MSGWLLRVLFERGGCGGFRAFGRAAGGGCFGCLRGVRSGESGDAV